MFVSLFNDKSSAIVKGKRQLWLRRWSDQLQIPQFLSVLGQDVESYIGFIIGVCMIENSTAQAENTHHRLRGDIKVCLNM